MDDASLEQSGKTGLERLCAAAGREHIRHDRAQPGLERMEAAFAGEAFAPHRHDTYALGITLRGVQSFSYRGERRFSLPGNVIVLHPDEVHDGAAGDDKLLQYRMLYLEPSRLAPALAAAGVGLPFLRNPVIDHPALAGLLRAVLTGIGDGLDALEADDFLARLAPLLQRLSGAGARPARHLPIAQLNRVRDFLIAHAGENITSPRLEAISGLDRFALLRSFRTLFGTTPHRFLIMRRLAEARELIGAGRPLAEVAIDTGFADQAHLTRHFKGSYGVTPGRWAELVRHPVKGVSSEM